MGDVASTTFEYYLNRHRRRGSDVTILICCNGNYGCRRVSIESKNIHNPVKVNISLRTRRSCAALIVVRTNIVPDYKSNVYSPFTCRNTDVNSRVVGHTWGNIRDLHRQLSTGVWAWIGIGSLMEYGSILRWRLATRCSAISAARSGKCRTKINGTCG